jgi:hypothetical protein
MSEKIDTADVLEGIKVGIVSRDVLSGRPVTFDERLRLEQMLAEKRRI